MKAVANLTTLEAFNAQVGLPYRFLWAKTEPFHALWRHMLDTTAVSLSLPFELDGFGKEALAALVGLHDVGKADPGFQQAPSFRAEHPEISERLVSLGFIITGVSNRQKATERGRHERISAHFVKDLLEAVGCDTRFADSLAWAVTAHHGHWERHIAPRTKAYQDAQMCLCELLLDALGLKKLAVNRPQDLSASGLLLAGHIVLCDWIASNEEVFARESISNIQDPREYLQAALKVATKALTRLGLLGEVDVGRPNEVVQRPRGVQSLLLELNLPPGLVIIEAPMGEGKTEAAWILSEMWRHFGYAGAYMALPTQATSESIFARYQKDYLRLHPKEMSARLVHGMAWLRDEIEPEIGPELPDSEEDADLALSWFRPTRRALLAMHGVGTVDQVLLAALNAKFGFLRLYGLHGRVLIVDEVHAYDAYMNAILQRLLAWCSALSVPVILLSATLSVSQRRAFVQAYGASSEGCFEGQNYPLVTWATSKLPPQFYEGFASSTRSLSIVPHPDLLGDVTATAELAKRLVSSGGCAVIIVNTVRQAQAIYRELDLPIGEKGLFHARFTAERREFLSNEVTRKFGKDTSNRPRRFVLVATQVVEQSLDVDFDFMVTEIAPIDLLLQRSGRLHRHRTRSNHPELHVLLPKKSVAFGGTERVYARYILLKTLDLIVQGRQIELPSDFRPLVEAVYGDSETSSDSAAWDDYENARLDWINRRKQLEDEARKFLLAEPESSFFRPVDNTPVGDDSDDGNGWRAKTRFGANDRTCIFVKEKEFDRTVLGEQSMKVIRLLYRRAVKVPSYVNLFEPEAGFGEAKIAKGRLRGLTVIPYGVAKEWKGGGWILTYDDEMGLMTRRT